MLCNSGCVSGLGRVSVNLNLNLYPRLNFKLTPGVAVVVYVGALWGQFGWFFPHFGGGGEQFLGNLVGFPSFGGGNLESKLAFFPNLGGNLGQFGPLVGGRFGDLAGLPPFGGGNWGYFGWSPIRGGNLGKFGWFSRFGGHLEGNLGQFAGNLAALGRANLEIWGPDLPRNLL